jgi:hypothetical protein
MTMSARRRFVPGVQARLEDRVVLSHAAVLTVGHGASLAAQVALALQGTVSGVEYPGPTATGGVRLVGGGTLSVSPTGRYPFSVIGSLTIRSGEPTFYDGHLTLTALLPSASGVPVASQIFVHIHGIVPGPTRLSVHLIYDITGGTGLFQGATGHGEVTYTQGPPPPPPANPVAGPLPIATFSLKFGDVALPAV